MLSGLIIKLNLALLYQVINHCKCHIRVHGTCTVAHKQSHMHNLTYLTALNNQSSLDTFLD